MTAHNVRISILLEPVGSPDVVVSCDQQLRELIINEPTCVDFVYSQEQGPSKLTVQHRNRQDNTTAIIVKSVKLNGIEHIQNTYQGIYYPIGLELRRDTYIAWEGSWILEFTVPVYTWLHKTQGLGWIYD